MRRSYNTGSGNSRSIEHHLRSTSPVVKPDVNHRKRLSILLQYDEVGHNKYHRPILAVVTGVLALVMFVGFNGDVGSDSFEVQQIGTGYGGRELVKDIYAKNNLEAPDHLSAEGVIYETKVRDFGIGVPQRLANNPGKAEEYAEQINEAFMAHAEKIIKISSFTLKGHTSHFFAMEVVVDGETQLTYSYEDGIPTEVLLKDVEFRVSYGSKFNELINSGQAKTLGTEIVQVDGVPIRFEKWSASFPEWGEVVAWKGKPLK